MHGDRQLMWGVTAKLKLRSMEGRSVRRGSRYTVGMPGWTVYRVVTSGLVGHVNVTPLAAVAAVTDPPLHLDTTTVSFNCLASPIYSLSVDYIYTDTPTLLHTSTHPLATPHRSDPSPVVPR